MARAAPFIRLPLASADSAAAAGDTSSDEIVGHMFVLPIVHDLLRASLGIAPRHEINPDLIVAMVDPRIKFE